MERIKDAIIIHGPGRSGTTLTSHILSSHKDLYWISTYVNKFPGWPIFSVFNNLYRLGIIAKYSIDKKKFPRPAEAYGFWQYYFREFTIVDGIPEQKEVHEFTETLQKIRKYSYGHRFITKLSGYSRVNFLNEVFENPLILWIDRKPEAVVMSYYKQRWGYKSRPEIFEATPKIKLIDEYSNRYLRHQLEKRKLKQFRFLQLYYEDLISDPVSFFTEICQITGLPMYRRFKKIIEDWGIYSGSNEAFRKYLNAEELEYLEAKLLKESKSLGYR